MTTTTAATTAKLICPECRRDNEAERIYCHDCGARLDRSAIAKAKAKADDPKVTQRRLQAMFDARRARRKQMFFLIAKVGLSALAVATIVQMVRPPDLPAAKPNAGILSAQISLDLDNAAMDPRVGPVRYSEEQVNGYLGYAMKNKQTALSKYVKFERLVVGFDEGACRATVERSLYGFPIYTSVAFAPAVNGTAITVKCRGGAIGRLPIHPMLMQYGDILFADVRTALEREKKSIVKLGAVELHPQQIIVSRRQP